MERREAVTLLGSAAVGLVGAERAGAAAAADPRAFELRTYWAAPGKAAALHGRFRDHTLALFRKHGMELVGFWVPADVEAGAGDKLVYLLAYPSRAAADAAWKAFRSDPEWLKAKAASETDGVLTAKVESVFLSATDYSPMR